MRPFDRGSRQAPKVRLTTDQGSFLLKRRQPDQASEERVRFSQAVQLHMMDRGVPVAHLIPDREGRTDVRRGISCYELFEFLPGSRPRPNEAVAFQSGTMLGHVHVAGRDFEPPGRSSVGSWHAVEALPAVLDALPRRIHRDDPTSNIEDLGRGTRFLRRAYADAAERANRTRAMDATPSLAHGDWHPGNLLAARDTVSAVLDFDSARLEPPVCDLANACLQMSMGRRSDDPDTWPGILEYDLIWSTVRGYESVVGRLSGPARRAIPWLMIEALLVETVGPLARTGRFGRFPGAPVLRMVERRVRWLRERHQRLIDFLGDD
ncbi:MAG: phosphotransferase enzyme family protein [Phycisphaerales bacterium]